MSTSDLCDKMIFYLIRVYNVVLYISIYDKTCNVSGKDF